MLRHVLTCLRVERGEVWTGWVEDIAKYLPNNHLFSLYLKEPACQCRRHKRCGFDPWVWKIPWRRAWQPTPVCLPGDPMERGTWPAIVHRVTKSWTQMKQLSMHAYPAIWITEQSVPFTSFTMVISLSKVLADRIDMSKSDVCNFLKHRHYLKWVTWPPFRLPLPWVPVSNTWRRVKCQGMEEQ